MIGVILEVITPFSGETEGPFFSERASLAMP